MVQAPRAGPLTGGRGHALRTYILVHAYLCSFLGKVRCPREKLGEGKEGNRHDAVRSLTALYYRVVFVLQILIVASVGCTPCAFPSIRPPDLPSRGRAGRMGFF